MAGWRAKCFAPEFSYLASLGYRATGLERFGNRSRDLPSETTGTTVATALEQTQLQSAQASGVNTLAAALSASSNNNSSPKVKMHQPTGSQDCDGRKRTSVPVVSAKNQSQGVHQRSPMSSQVPAKGKEDWVGAREARTLFRNASPDRDPPQGTAILPAYNANDESKVGGNNQSGAHDGDAPPTVIVTKTPGHWPVLRNTQFHASRSNTRLSKKARIQDCDQSHSSNTSASTSSGGATKVAAEGQAGKKASRKKKPVNSTRRPESRQCGSGDSNALLCEDTDGESEEDSPHKAIKLSKQLENILRGKRD